MPSAAANHWTTGLYSSEGQLVTGEANTPQTRDIHPMLFQCWFTVEDSGPASKQH